MSGPTLAMAPAVESSSGPFHRSHSTPDLLSSSLAKPPASIAALSAHHRTLSCKSLPSLPAFDIPSFDLDSDFSIPILGPGPRKATIAAAAQRKAQPQSITVDAPAAARPEVLARRKSLIDRPRSWIPTSRSTPNVRDLVDGGSRGVTRDNGSAASAARGVADPKLVDRSRTVSESFADFARRSWISGSRSPSPKGRSPAPAENGPAGEPRQRSASGGSPSRAAIILKKRASLGAGAPAGADHPEAGRSAESPGSKSRALTRASVYLTKIKQRPQSVFVKGASALSLTSHADDDSGPKTAGLDLSPFPERSTLPRNSSQTAVSSDGSVDSVNASTGAESHSTADTSPMPSRSASRDPLWVAFRDLEASFVKFAAKMTTAQKMALVRAVLIPFLRRHAHDGSGKEARQLPPEAIERRAAVLSRWWNGLLELLDGPAGRVGPEVPGGAPGLLPIAGVDRPSLLEAITMIMVRPEWRLNTPAFRPLVDRSPAEKVRARSNTADSSIFEEMGSSFLEESAEHNVRTMFVNNLTAQMALVVDRMSLRHAPLSLVNFSGRACAYAFFFVPGIADVLVRLWGLDGNVDLIRRIADGIGLPRRSKGESDDIVALFPPNLGPLGWSSVSAMGLKLRRAAKLNVQLANIPWRGPWVARWRGGDTDLFFVFCKYFFVLADEFMPSELPLLEKSRAPAFVLLLAQLLQILDTTIHRQAAFEAMVGPQMSDALLGPDASLTGLPPLLPSNLLRGMDENRMIVLLKDFLSLGESMPGARHTFTESFMALLVAAVKKTSQYDHNACYILCDFLEQTLLALDGYFGYTVPSGQEEATTQPPRPRVDYIDWPFWFDVFKMVLASNNTMSEIRMLSFVFSAWDIIAADPARKEDLCVNWLLTEEVFEKMFNNWCPMVRAYYMRLLCWRVCRDAGSANDLDTTLFVLVSQRLKTVWSHYLWLKQKADAEGVFPPSTAPSLPQPGRRFMIVRTELVAPQPGLFASFDSITSSFGSLGQSGADYPGQLSGSGSGDNTRAENSNAAKKRWSLLGKVLSFTSSSGVANTSSDEQEKPSYEEQFEQVRRDLAATRLAASQGRQQESLGAPQPPPKPSTSAAASDDSSTGSSPVFDTAQFVFRFTLHTIPWQVGPNGLLPPLFRDRVLARPRLPAPAQAKVSAKAASGGRSESPPPPAPGLPPPNRRFSGLMAIGLVSEARNANPADSVPADDGGSSSRASMGSRCPSYESKGSNGRASNSSLEERGRGPGRDNVMPRGGGDPRLEGGRELESERQAIQPVEPKGSFVLSSKYAGRSLAEWGMVVSECNSFVDRRRDEGVLGLKEVEVPTLGVEGLRRLA